MAEWRVFFETAVESRDSSAHSAADTPPDTEPFDIWKYLDIESRSWFGSHSPEERTDWYILIPDARFGLKLRGGVKFELKVGFLVPL